VLKTSSKTIFQGLNALVDLVFPLLCSASRC